MAQIVCSMERPHDRAYCRSPARSFPLTNWRTFSSFICFFIRALSLFLSHFSVDMLLETCYPIRQHLTEERWNGLLDRNPLGFGQLVHQLDYVSPAAIRGQIQCPDRMVVFTSALALSHESPFLQCTQLRFGYQETPATVTGRCLLLRGREYGRATLVSREM